MVSIDCIVTLIKQSPIPLLTIIKLIVSIIKFIIILNNAHHVIYCMTRNFDERKS